MRYFVGIDVSMEESSLCVVDASGEVAGEAGEAVVATEPEAIAAALSRYGLDAVKVGFEAGALSPWLYHELTALGLDVVCLETRRVHQILKTQRNKTDRGEAFGIAQIVRSGWYGSVHVKSYDSHALRALLGARDELVCTRQDLENTVRGLLKPFGLRLAKGGRGDFADRVRALCVSRVDLAAAVEALLGARAAVRDELGRLDERLIAMAREVDACPRLMTIPGVGPITALSAISAIDDAGRFAHARTAGAYFGLTPRRHQSGEVDYQGRISKRGDGMVRTLLYEAANVLLTRVTRFSTLKAWGLRLAKRVGMKKARVAVARKLAVIIAAILKDGTEFWWKAEPAATA